MSGAAIGFIVILLGLIFLGAATAYTGGKLIQTQANIELYELKKEWKRRSKR